MLNLRRRAPLVTDCETDDWCSTRPEPASLLHMGMVSPIHNDQACV